MIKNIYLIDSLRTPIGNPYKGLKDFKAPELAALCIKEILRRNQLTAPLLDEIILGNTVSAGSGQNLARQAVGLAGLPVTTPALTINNVCGSGLHSVILAAQAIIAGDADMVLAGGTESVSHNPYLAFKNDEIKIEEKDFMDSLVHDGLWCSLTNKHMGQLAEALADEFHIHREAQDRYSLESHHKACRAQKDNKFRREMISVLGKQSTCMDRDDHPRVNVDLEKLRSLPPAFMKNGTVTAGNSSVPCDGAACVLAASEEFIKINNGKPKAKILSYATVALDPEKVFTAGVKAVQECLKKADLSLRGVDLFEISESFAVQAIWTRQQLNIPEEKMNIWGGDVALGHPLGAAGARVLVTLLHALEDQKKKNGVAVVCFGGGGAVAMAIEMV